MDPQYIVFLYMINAVIFGIFFYAGELDFFFWRQPRFWLISLLPGAWAVLAILWIIKRFTDE